MKKSRPMNENNNKIKAKPLEISRHLENFKNKIEQKFFVEVKMRCN